MVKAQSPASESPIQKSTSSNLTLSKSETTLGSRLAAFDETMKDVEKRIGVLEELQDESKEGRNNGILTEI